MLRGNCAKRLNTPSLPHPDIAGECVNRDPVCAWCVGASGKLLCRDRCHPAAAVTHKATRVQTKGGIDALDRCRLLNQSITCNPVCVFSFPVCLNPSPPRSGYEEYNVRRCLYPIKRYCLLFSQHKASILLLPFFTEPIRLFVYIVSVRNMCAVGMPLNNAGTHLRSPWIHAVSDKSKEQHCVSLYTVVYCELKFRVFFCQYSYIYSRTLWQIHPERAQG